MEVLEIFTLMHWSAIILLSVGFVFFIVEVLMPGFGFFGIAGGVCVLTGVIIRIVQGLNFLQVLVLILLILGVFILGFVIMVISAKYGLLGRTALFETNTTLSVNYNQPEQELKKLVGKSGRTISSLNLGGQAKIKGKIYDVVSESSFIEKGKTIKVVAIKDNNIIVRKWFK